MEEELKESVYNHISESEDYISLVNKLTQNQTKVLDSIVLNVSNLLKRNEYDLDIRELQYNYLNLATELYNMVDKLKQFEVYASLAKSNQVEKYNKEYLVEATSYDKKPSATELQIRAESKSSKENLVSTVYASAFKAIKSKIDAASALADSLKNIIKTKNNIDFSTNQAEKYTTY